jgi:hypothetical protein
MLPGEEYRLNRQLELCNDVQEDSQNNQPRVR